MTSSMGIQVTVNIEDTSLLRQLGSGLLLLWSLLRNNVSSQCSLAFYTPSKQGLLKAAPSGLVRGGVLFSALFMHKYLKSDRIERQRMD